MCSNAHVAYKQSSTVVGAKRNKEAMHTKAYRKALLQKRYNVNNMKGMHCRREQHTETKTMFAKAHPPTYIGGQIQESEQTVELKTKNKR